jgi:hypothetical protein
MPRVLAALSCTNALLTRTKTRLIGRARVRAHAWVVSARPKFVLPGRPIPCLARLGSISTRRRRARARPAGRQAGGLRGCRYALLRGPSSKPREAVIDESVHARLLVSSRMDRVTCVEVHNSLAYNLHWVRRRASQFKRFLVDARSARTGFATWSLFNLGWPLTNLEEMVVLGPLRAMDVEAFLQRNFHCRALRRLGFPRCSPARRRRQRPKSSARRPRRKAAATSRSGPSFWMPIARPPSHQRSCGYWAQRRTVADVPELVLDFAV